MQIEPEAKIVQTHFGSQTGLKSSQIMRTLTSQAEGIQEFVVDGFDDLPKTCQPSAQRFGPPKPLIALMRCSHHIYLMLLVPPSMRSFSSKAFVSNVGAVSGQACTGQAR
jgi:hypothetical protein